VIIKRLKIHNFGPFHNTHEIILANDGNGIHVIRGSNGQGKTSIQRAVLWCLYGQVYDRKGDEIPPTSLLNRTAFSDDIFDFFVGIYFNHDGQEWSIIRKMASAKGSNKKLSSSMRLQVRRDDDNLENGQNEILRLIPQDVSRFFFFDGEMLRDYEELLEESSPSMLILRDSIEQILGIPLLKTARDDVQEVKKKMEAERSRLVRKLGGKEYDQLANELQEITDNIETSLTRKKEYESQIKEMEKSIQDEKRKLNDIRNVQSLANDREKIELKISGLESKKENEYGKLNDLTSRLYKTILAPIAGNLIHGLEQQHRKKMEKYDKKKGLEAIARELREGLEGTKCKTCGSVLDEVRRKGLFDRIKEIEIEMEELTEIPEPNLEYQNDADRLKKIVKEAVDRESFKRIEVTILELEHDIAAQRAKEREISEKLRGADTEEPRRIESLIQRSKQEVGRVQGLLEKEEEALQVLYETKSNLDQRLNAIPKMELQNLTHMISETSKIAGVFERAITQYRDEKRSEVEIEASRIFKEIRCKESFAGLKINDRYGLSIITDSGLILDKAEWRSAGEEQIIAYSLIGALNRCAKIKAPVFMDTPFGRLDLAHGRNVLAFLPNLSEQVVLLVTDRELRLGEESAFMESVVTDLTVQHRGEKEGSFIVQTRGVV